MKELGAVTSADLLTAHMLAPRSELRGGSAAVGTFRGPGQTGEETGELALDQLRLLVQSLTLVRAEARLERRNTHADVY